MLKEITKSLDKYLIVSNQRIFQNLNMGERVFIANRCQFSEYSKGDIVYSKGDERDYFNVLISGRILLFDPKTEKQSKERPMDILLRGDYFGIISILTGRPHSLSARVINDTKILRIEQKAFKAILEKVPRLAVHFSKTLSRRLKRNYSGEKGIYESTILSVYYDGDEAYTSRYVNMLANSIVAESRKKVEVISIDKRPGQKVSKGVSYRDITSKEKDRISAVLTGSARDHHFVIANMPSGLGRTGEQVLNQSDVCHIICDEDKEDVGRAEMLSNKIRQKSNNNIKIIVREKSRAMNVVKNKPLKRSENIYMFLPCEAEKYNQVIKRISRELSGIRIGLALGSGGALGLAQIGVLEAIEENEIPIDALSGTSIGAIISSLWVSGYSAKEIQDVCGSFGSKFRTISLVDITVPRMGFIGGKNIRKLLSKHLKDKTFNDTKIPLKIIACDINSRKEVVISSGKLIDAVMSSIAIPGIISPVIADDGRILVDGGVVNPVPISVLVKDGIRRIIAVNSMPSPEDSEKIRRKKPTIFDIIVNSFYSMEYRIGKYSGEKADVYMHPILKGAQWFEFYRAKEFVRFGKKEALKVLPDIKKLVK